MGKRRAEPAERESWYDCRTDDSASGGRALRDLTVEGCCGHYSQEQGQGVFRLEATWSQHGVRFMFQTRLYDKTDSKFLCRCLRNNMIQLEEL